jgi:hypothetical protein
VVRLRTGLVFAVIAVGLIGSGSLPKAAAQTSSPPPSPSSPAPGPGAIRLLIPSSASPAHKGEPAVSVIQTAAGAQCYAQIAIPSMVVTSIGGGRADGDGRLTFRGDVLTLGTINGTRRTDAEWWEAPGPRILTVTCRFNGGSATQEFRFDVQ